MHCNQMINIIHHRVEKERNWNVSQEAGREETIQHVCVYAPGIDRLARCWISLTGCGTGVLFCLRFLCKSIEVFLSLSLGLNCD